MFLNMQIDSGVEYYAAGLEDNPLNSGWPQPHFSFKEDTINFFQSPWVKVWYSNDILGRVLLKQYVAGSCWNFLALTAVAKRRFIVVIY